MPDISRAQYQGLLVQDKRFTLAYLDMSQSVLTQAEPSPGTPSPGRDTAFSLLATGDQNPNTELQILTVQGGYPGQGKAGFVWKYDGDTNYRGWDNPGTVTSWDTVVWDTTSGQGYPQAITLADGTVLVAVHKFNGGNEVLRVYRNVAGVWYTVNLTTLSTAPIHRFQPCLVLLPSGRVLCYAWVEDGDNAQVRMWYSDSNGASWSIGQYACLPENIDISGSVGAGNPGFDLGRIRAAYSSGQVLLIVGLDAHDTDPQPTNPARSTFYQYVSINFGITFDLVEAVEISDTSDHIGTAHDLIALPYGGFGFSYVKYSSLPVEVTTLFKSIPDGFTPLSSLTPVQIDTLVTGSVTTGKVSGESALSLLDDGKLYCYARTTTAVLQVVVFACYSEDYGLTWAKTGRSPNGTIPGAIYRIETNTPGSLDTYPIELSACYHQGRVLLFHRHTNSGGSSYDNSLSMLVCGGYSDVTLPNTTAFRRSAYQYAWEHTFIPFQTRENLNGYTVNKTGTPTLAISSNKAENWVTAGGDTIECLHPSVSSGGVICSWSVAVTSGSVILQVSANDYEATLTLTPTGYTLTDSASGSNLATGSLDLTGFYTFLIGVDGGKCGVWYRTSDSNPDRVWSVLGVNKTLTTGGTGNRIRQYQGASSNSETRYLFWLSGGGDFYSQDNPNGLYWKDYSSYPVYVNAGLLLAVQAGYTFTGDYWSISTRYGYGIEKAHPELYPSPRHVWRSTSDSSDVSLVWVLGSEDSQLDSPAMGVYLGGVNFQTAELWGYPAGGAWELISTIDGATGQTGLAYTRLGNQIIPADAGADAYYNQHRLAGCYFMDVGTGTIRKIRTNSPGVWSTTTSPKQVRITLDDFEASDPTSGTCHIISKDRVAIIQKPADTYSAFKLVIPAQPTLEGYFEAGVIYIGSVYYFGKQYAWGRGVGLEPGAELATQRSGVRTSRVNSPARRTINVSWSDGVDLTKLSTLNPDYILPYEGATEAAANVDTPYQIAGLVDSLNGSDQPVVYLAAIPKAQPDTGSGGGVTTTQVNKEQFLYGRVVSPVQIDTVLGDECSDELVRLSTFTISEEI